MIGNIVAMGLLAVATGVVSAWLSFVHSPTMDKESQMLRGVANVYVFFRVRLRLARCHQVNLR